MANILPTDPLLALYQAVAAELLARDQAEAPLAQAARAASETMTPETQAAFKEALDALSEADRDDLMAAVHRRMRQDLVRIWDFMASAPPNTRLN